MQLISKTNIKIIYSLHSHDKIEKKKGSITHILYNFI